MDLTSPSTASFAELSPIANVPVPVSRTSPESKLFLRTVNAMVTRSPSRRGGAPAASNPS